MRQFLVFIVTFSISFFSFSEEDVNSLLMKMADSFRKLDYKGQVMYEQNSQMNSVEIVHMVKDGKEYERVLTLDGSQNELIREGKPVDCYQPGELILRDYLPQGLIKHSSRLEDYYNFSIDGEVRIAGREAQLLKISPKDNFRFGYALSIDKESGLLLHSQMFSEKGKVLEQFKFTSLQLDNIDESSLKPTTKNAKKIAQGDCMDESHLTLAAEGPWDVDLPKGYAFCIYEQPKDLESNALVYF